MVRNHHRMFWILIWIVLVAVLVHLLGSGSNNQHVSGPQPGISKAGYLDLIAISSTTLLLYTLKDTYIYIHDKKVLVTKFYEIDCKYTLYKYYLYRLCYYTCTSIMTKVSLYCLLWLSCLFLVWTYIDRFIWSVWWSVIMS